MLVVAGSISAVEASAPKDLVMEEMRKDEMDSSSIKSRDCCRGSMNGSVFGALSIIGSFKVSSSRPRTKYLAIEESHLLAIDTV